MPMSAAIIAPRSRNGAPAADQGNADAQFNMGQAYKLGRGVAVDLKAAEAWYRKAALQGHEQAEGYYGLALFENGKRADAVPWLQRAVGRGDAARAVHPRHHAVQWRRRGEGLGPRLCADGPRLLDRARRRGQGARADGPIYAAGRSPAGPRLLRASTKTNSTRAAVRCRRSRSRRIIAPSRPPSPRPAPRTTPPAPLRAAPDAPPPLRYAPRRPPAQDGGWRVQLGAFGDPGNARKLWSQVSGRFPGRQPYFVKTGALTRLLVGPFASRAAAAGACGGVKPCVPVAR